MNMFKHTYCLQSVYYWPVIRYTPACTLSRDSPGTGIYLAFQSSAQSHFLCRQIRSRRQLNYTAPVFGPHTQRMRRLSS